MNWFVNRVLPMEFLSVSQMPIVIVVCVASVGQNGTICTGRNQSQFMIMILLLVQQFFSFETVKAPQQLPEQPTSPQLRHLSSVCCCDGVEIEVVLLMLLLSPWAKTSKPS